MIDPKLNERVEELSKKAIDKWGVDSQFDMMIEETAELLEQLVRIKRNRQDWDKILEEVTDVYQMCIEMSMIFGHENFNAMLEKKLDKFENNLKGD